MYSSWLQQESGPRIKALWELQLNMEIAQLQAACDLMRRHDDREPAEILPAEVPEPVLLESNKDYVRGVLASQCDLTSLGTGYVMDAHKRFQDNLAKVNSEGAPSEQVIDLHRERFGTEYRLETEGPHPVEKLRVGAGTR